ncbi:hypothetical protein DC522_31340 [Microvirga sp. KLBC 81]|nr:hypothetical protein DC522_31340 [Microvirga sp. KLBC 81]
MVTRFPVIGSRMVMGSPLPFKQTENAACLDWIRVASSCGYETVTALGLSQPQSMVAAIWLTGL